jgi:hypothetical protein
MPSPTGLERGLAVSIFVVRIKQKTSLNAGFCLASIVEANLNTYSQELWL